MKRNIVCILVVILLTATVVMPVVVSLDKEATEIEKKIVDIKNNDETFMAPRSAFLFGRINNKHEGGAGWICDSVNLRIIILKTLERINYTDGETVEVVKPGLGIFTNRFIIGFYKVWT